MKKLLFIFMFFSGLISLGSCSSDADILVLLW